MSSLHFESSFWVLAKALGQDLSKIFPSQLRWPKKHESSSSFGSEYIGCYGEITRIFVQVVCCGSMLKFWKKKRIPSSLPFALRTRLPLLANRLLYPLRKGAVRNDEVCTPRNLWIGRRRSGLKWLWVKPRTEASHHGIYYNPHTCQQTPGAKLLIKVVWCARCSFWPLASWPKSSISLARSNLGTAWQTDRLTTHNPGISQLPGSSVGHVFLDATCHRQQLRS